MDSGTNFTSGVVTQLQGPSRAPAILAGNLIPELIATSFYFARVYARAWLLRSWGADDTLLAISWIGSIILCICSCLSTKYGSGHHIWDIPPIPHEYIIPNLRTGFVSLLIYQLTLALTKLSICLFYLRLFNDKATKYMVYTTMGFICLYTIPTIIFSVFQCKPVDGYWNVTETSTCVDPSAAFYVNGIGNILTDAWLVVMIAPRIWSLKMARKQKIALFAIITLSWLVIIAAIVRMVRLSHLFRQRVIDTPWAFYDISIWTGLEVSMGIFCVSAPVIKPIFKQFAPHFLSSYGYSDSKDRYNGSSGPTNLATPQNRRSEKMWFKDRGTIELHDGPRIQSYVNRSVLRSQCSSELWTRDVERDSWSSEGILPFMGGLEKGRNVVYKHTVVTVVETRDGRQSQTGTTASNDKSSIDSGDDLNNRSVLKFSSSSTE